MNVPEDVSAWIAKQENGQIISSEPIAGGCINNGSRLTTDSGATYFLKQNSSVPDDMFAREAQGLKALMVESGPRVPIPHLHSHTFLLLEDLKPARRKSTFWRTFGVKLANLHQNTHSKFGFDQDNYIGSTPQKNTWTTNGFEFFATHRLSFQADLAMKGGYFETTDQIQLEEVIKKLPTLIPEQPASLLHGDLWSGNAITDEEGNPAVIDPAVHYGWAEAELGMTALFGGFPQESSAAYNDELPLESGWRDRLQIYNLYHLLNHVNLFGYGYLGQVRAILKRYA
jgi:fructosamine-3-kinase